MRDTCTKILLSAVLAALGSAGLAEQSCFSRSYSKAHLAANPDQTVETLSIRFEGPARDGPSTGEWGDVTVYFKADPRKYIQTLYCSTYDGARHCGVECDGGSAALRWINADTLLLKTSGFIVSGGCDGDGEITRMVKDTGAASTTFRLNRVAMTACPPLDAQ